MYENERNCVMNKCGNVKWKVNDERCGDVDGSIACNNNNKKKATPKHIKWHSFWCWPWHDASSKLWVSVYGPSVARSSTDCITSHCVWNKSEHVNRQLTACVMWWLLCVRDEVYENKPTTILRIPFAVAVAVSVAVAQQKHTCTNVLLSLYYFIVLFN